jgi:hypothetical protein
MARELGVSPSTVALHVHRLGRHCLLFQHARLRPSGPPPEPLVTDGFESFEFSQYHPMHFHLAAGAHSHLLYAFTDSELRRKGRMTPHQKRRRQEIELRLGRPDPKSIEKEMAGLLELVVPPGAAVRVLSDEHPAYRRADRRLARRGIAVSREVTPSTQARTAHNPLFPVNRLDLWIRHASANHKRETIAFSKRRLGAALRLAILQVWLNAMKPFSERKRDRSPAERLGLLDHRLTVREVLAERLFPWRVGLPERLMDYYRGRVRTRALPVNREHRLAYAF